MVADSAAAEVVTAVEGGVVPADTEAEVVSAADSEGDVVADVADSSGASGVVPTPHDARIRASATTVRYMFCSRVAPCDATGFQSTVVQVAGPQPVCTLWIRHRVATIPKPE